MLHAMLHSWFHVLRKIAAGKPCGGRACERCVRCTGSQVAEAGTRAEPRPSIIHRDVAIQAICQAPRSHDSGMLRLGHVDEMRTRHATSSRPARREKSTGSLCTQCPGSCYLHLQRQCARNRGTGVKAAQRQGLLDTAVGTVCHVQWKAYARVSRRSALYCHL